MSRELAAQLRRAAEVIENYEGDALGDDPRTFDEWVMLSDAAKAIESMPDRDAVNSAVGAVLFNASNYPPAVQFRMLGQDTSGLRKAVTDAVMDLLYPPTH